jgi:UDPglucose--hexose-1-phosphate uridylyltransferase
MQFPEASLPDAAFLAHCPFEPGHESMTPPAVFTLPQKEEHSWQVRVFENKYPIVTMEDTTLDRERDMYIRDDGRGVHWVIAECEHVSSHNPVLQETLLDSYHRVFLALQEQHPELSYIQLFQNVGKEAGASLPHPHSQVLGTVLVPERMRRMTEGFFHYRSLHHHCPLCMLADEGQGKESVLFSTEHFVVVMPFWSRFPYEAWIIPRTHTEHFTDMPESHRSDLARAQMHLLELYKKGLGEVPYNMMLYTSPVLTSGDFHWHMEYTPRIGLWAGFELSTGMLVNSVSPEDARKVLLGE